MGLCYIYYVTAKVDSTEYAVATMEDVTMAGDVTTESTSYITKELAETTFLVSFGATYRIGGSDSGFVDDEDEKAGKKKDKKSKKTKKSRKTKKEKKS